MNFGVEGETDDEAIIEAREKQKRNLLATLLLSQGVPMLLGGDEIGRTQRGNNNGYAQDNEISWFDWVAEPPRSPAARLHPVADPALRSRTRSCAGADSSRAARSAARGSRT